MIEFLQVSVIICAVWGVVSAINMGVFLTNRGHKVNIWLYRFLMFRYIRKYKKITTEEYGQPGFWYYSFTYSMMLVLVFVVVGLIKIQFG
jgi:hypothetical protein